MNNETYEVVGNADDDEAEAEASDHHNKNGHPVVQWPWDRKGKASLPEAKDWRNEGVITPVKHQGSCGSCWAFTAAGVLESAYAIKTGKKIELSEQQILDCVNYKSWFLWLSSQCQGGFVQEAFDFAKDHYITERKKYPYRGKNLQCRLKGKKDVDPKKEENVSWVGKKFD